MVDPEQVYNRRTDNWHFEKRLSLDTLVSVVGVAIVLGGPVLYWGRAMENRVQVLEVERDTRNKQETARDLDARDSRISLLARMDKLDEQVTQLRIDIGKIAVLPPMSGQMNGIPRR